MSDAWRATLFTSALYLLVGASLPYLPVWMEQGRGMLGWQIAGAISIATLFRIIAGPVSAAWGERYGLRRVFLVLSASLAAGYVALLLAPGLWSITFLVIVLYLAWGAAMPLSEALLMATTRGTRPDYGVARAIGSAAFIAASLATGWLVRVHGPDSAVIWMAAAGLVMVACAATLSQDAPAMVQRPSLLSSLREGITLYRDRRILLAGISAALIQSAHAQYYNFSSIIWIAQGIGETHVGALWSTGVAAEIVFLAISGAVLKGRAITPGALIVLGGLGAGLRWTIMGFAPGLDVLYPLQTLHALSFAVTLLGTLRLLEEEVRADKIPIVVSINSALGFGPLMAIAGFAGGVLFDALASGGPDAQAQTYWPMAVMGVVGVAVALPLVKRRHPQSAGIGGDTTPSV